MYPTWPGVLMDFAQSRETDRDYFLQRVQETTSAPNPETMPESGHPQSDQ